MGPDPWLTGAGALALLLLLFIGHLSRLETGVLNARRSRLALVAADRRAAAADAVLDTPDTFQASAHLAKSLCESLFYAAAALIGLELALLARPGPLPQTLWMLIAQAWPGILGAALVGYLLVTVLGEAVPKALAARDPERVLLRNAGFIRLFTLLFTPFLWLTRRMGRFLATTAGTDPHSTARAAHSEEEIKLLVEGSAEEGVLEEEEKEMIHSIIEFTDTVARQVMVPRIDVQSVPVDGSLDDVLRRAIASGHSRLPVHEGTLDTVVGVIHVKDLLPCLVEGRRDVEIRDLMRAPFFVPEGKKLDELLQEFRAHKSQMAIVVDEFGGTSGVVTIEDVVEEIVGEIEDEYDVDEQPGTLVVEGTDGTLVDARMTLEDVNEELRLELPPGDYDTLGGFVFSLFGRPPQEGESVEHEGIRFTAVAMDGLRLLKIRIAPVEADAAGEEELPD